MTIKCETPMNKTLDWLPALAFLVFGAVFFYASFQIQSFSGGNGARLIPTAASFLIVVLSAFLLISYMMGGGRSVDTSIDAKEFLLYSGPLILLMGVYALFHHWFGYMMATFLCGLAGFKLFGNSWSSSFIHAVAGTLVLYVTFVKLLKVYDPPGRLIDLGSFF